MKNTIENNSFSDFLEKINLWVEEILKRHEKYNPERVRSNVLASFEDEMEKMPKVHFPSIRKSNKSVGLQAQKSKGS